MIVTVSNENGIKQYDVPEQIKGILFIVVVFLFLVVGSLSFYIKSLNDKLTLLEKRIKIEKIVEVSNKNHILHLSDDIETKLQKEKSLKSDLAQFEEDKIKKRKEESKRLKIMALKKANEEKRNKEKLEKVKVEKEKLLRLSKERKKREEHLKKETAIQLEKLAKEKAKKKRLHALKIEEEKKRKKEKLVKEKAKKEKILKLAALKKAKARKEKLLKLKKEKVVRTNKITQNKKKYKSNNKLENLPKIAKSKLGKRYVWGAIGPSVFDCSGFTSYVYKKTGIRIPRTSRQQSKYGKLVDRKHLKPGDLIFFDTSHSRRGIVNHVGMYIGNNQFIHASSAKKRVVITQLSNFYRQRFKWARRVIN